MKLTLIPQLGADGDVEMTINVSRDTITIDGVPYDLSAVPEGGEGWPDGESPFIAPITRQGGVLHVTIVARLGETTAPNPSGPWVIESAAGDVLIPAKRMEDFNETAD